MKLALSILLVVTSVVMILLVLLHKGKGSGLSDLFGGGISSNYGGSSVVERNLDRITIVVGGLWFALVVALSLSRTGAQMAMKFVHHLLKKRQSSFLLSGIAQSADSRQVVIKIIHLAQSRMSHTKLTLLM